MLCFLFFSRSIQHLIKQKEKHDDSISAFFLFFNKKNGKEGTAHLVEMKNQMSALDRRLIRRISSIIVISLSHFVENYFEIFKTLSHTYVKTSFTYVEKKRKKQQVLKVLAT